MKHVYTCQVLHNNCAVISYFKGEAQFLPVASVITNFLSVLFSEFFLCNVKLQRTWIKVFYLPVISELLLPLETTLWMFCAYMRTLTSRDNKRVQFTIEWYCTTVAYINVQLHKLSTIINQFLMWIFLYFFLQFFKTNFLFRGKRRGWVVAELEEGVSLGERRAGGTVQ